MHDGTVEALDWRLDPVASAPVPPDVADAKLLTATPDLKIVVASDKTAVIICRNDPADQAEPVRVPMDRADSATLMPDGLLLVTAPIFETRVWNDREYEAKGEHRAVLIDALTGDVRDEAVLPVADAGVIALSHPYDGSVLLDAGEGQDGNSVFRARVIDRSLAIDEVFGNAIAASFHPSGDRLLLTPHPSFGGPVLVLGWPDLRPVAELAPEAVDAEDDYLDIYGCFLSNDRILASAGERSLLLCTGDLRPLAWIDVPGTGAGEAELEDGFYGLAEDAFAVDLWHGDRSSALVCRIPETSSQ